MNTGWDFQKMGNGNGKWLVAYTFSTGNTPISLSGNKIMVNFKTAK